jgi:hypothetical protein
MTNAPIVFLDTETDGVHPGRKVWEVAMIRRDEGGERETSFYVEPNLETADSVGLNVGRFYERHPLGRYLSGLESCRAGVEVSPKHAAYTVARWTHGAHIVGAVPNFDTEVLGALMREHGLTPAWHYHLIDVEALAFGWLHGVAAHGHSSVACSDSPVDCNWWGEMAEGVSDEERDLTRPPFRSDDLSRACGVEPPSDEERHTAMGDAKWAMRLYDRITGGAE